MQMLVDRVRAYCLRHSLFEPGPVVVAVSGGADSLTLLHVLVELQNDLQIAPHAATFDHGIRGRASLDDVDFVRRIAGAWNVPCLAGAEDTPRRAQEWRLGLEAAARRARYGFLAEAAREIGAWTIAAGHHQDDQAETVLMHVLRGTGLGGLRGMLPKAPLDLAGIDLPLERSGHALTLVRPLLDVPRTETESYLLALGVEPRIDATNTDLAYTRNRLRHEILPLLETINPQVRAALARLGEMAREDYETLLGTLPPLTIEGLRLSLERAQFLALRPAQQRLLIRLAAHRLRPGAEISFERTETALQFVAEGSFGGVGIQLGGGVCLKMVRKHIIFYLAESLHNEGAR